MKRNNYLHSEAGREGSASNPVIRAILFDKDGTLFDFRRTWLPFINDAAAELAGDDPIPAERLVRAAGYDAGEDVFLPDGPLAAGNSGDIVRAWREILPGLGSDLDPESLRQHLDQRAAAVGPQKSVPVCDLSHLVTRLREAGLRLGLATSDSEAGARATLARFGVLDSFCWVTGYDSDGGPDGAFGPKPDPRIVVEFARRAGVSPRETAVVGDTFHDMRMGRDAGAGLVVAVLTGAVSAEMLRPRADVVLSSIAEIPGFLGLPPV